MNSFISRSDREIGERFLRDGYVISPVEEPLALDLFHAIIQPHEPEKGADLNKLKLERMAALNANPKARECYYFLAMNLLHAIVGNELAMQRKFNLNVQVPGDERQLLPIHADTWTGDSPFQVVVWLPLVNCYRTKSLWLLPPYAMKHFRLEGSSEEMTKRIEPYVKYLDVKYGEVLVFNSCLPHGNTVNREDSTRWSLNCRFKSVFSPYGRKELGEHFEPITLRPASRIGLDYRHPA